MARGEWYVREGDGAARWKRVEDGERRCGERVMGSCAERTEGGVSSSRARGHGNLVAREKVNGYGASSRRRGQGDIA